MAASTASFAAPSSRFTPANSAEMAFILAAWSPTSLITPLAKSATRLVAMRVRSATRLASSLMAGLGTGFLADPF